MNRPLSSQPSGRTVPLHRHVISVEGEEEEENIDEPRFLFEKDVWYEGYNNTLLSNNINDMANILYNYKVDLTYLFGLTSSFNTEQTGNQFKLRK